MRRGRVLRKTPTKVLARIRLDADVIAFFRSLGPGYQSQINEVLRRVKEEGLTNGSARTTGKRAVRQPRRA